MGQYKCDRCGRRIWVDAGDVRLCHSCEEQLKEDAHELRTENEDYCSSDCSGDCSYHR